MAYTDISCATWDTKEDKAMADEWAEKEAGNPVQGIPQEEIDRAMPEIREMAERDMERCLEENAKEAQEAIREALKDAIPNELEKLDLEVWPTQEQKEEMVKAGKELGVPLHEIIFTPPIVGTPGVENMEEKIRDVMEVLHTSKIPPEFRDVSAISKITFVNQQKRTPVGGYVRAEVYSPRALEEKPERVQVLRIFRDEKGRFPSLSELQVILPHEIFHINDFMEQIEEHKAEWTAAVAMAGRDSVELCSSLPIISEHAKMVMKKYERGEIDRKERNSELSPDLYVLYSATDRCPPEIAGFFGNYLSVEHIRGDNADITNEGVNDFEE